MLQWVLNLLCFHHLSSGAPTKGVNLGDVKDARFWNSLARANIDQKLQMYPHLLKAKRPKNVILFIGDGMGISTVTSARINKNQRAGNSHLNSPLFFEKFQTSGLLKTSSLSNHVTDSAAGATALLTGRKVNTRTLGMLPGSKVPCADSSEMHIVDGVVEGVLQKNMSVGFVTNTRITHATPAALYAKGVDREAEYDEAEVRCARDIGKQLLTYPASEFKIMMGGGSQYLMEKSRNGSRGDNLNIDLSWLSLGGKRKVLRTLSDLAEVDGSSEEKLLGIFSDSHFPFYLNERLEDKQTVPRLHEMTQIAIQKLQQEEGGFFLTVEGGLIDIAEHQNQMHVTFSEMYEFEEAIRVAREMTSPSETLIIVTADHGHALTLPGYLPAEETIFESSKAGDDENGEAKEESFVPAMFFATGPGYRGGFGHHDNIELEQPLYRHPAAIPAKFGYHGGEDVGIWTDGPFSELFSSTLENTEVAYIVKFILCAGTADYTICDVEKREGELTTPSPLDEFDKKIVERLGVKAVTIAAFAFMVIATISLLITTLLASMLYVQNKSISSKNNYKVNF